MNDEAIQELEDIKIITRNRKTTLTESATTYDDQQDQQSLDDNEIAVNDNNSNSDTQTNNIQISYSSNGHSNSHSKNRKKKHLFLNMKNNSNISSKSVPYNNQKYRSKYMYLSNCNKHHNKYAASVIDDNIDSSSVIDDNMSNISGSIVSEIDDEKTHKKHHKLKRANTWTAPQKNDLINQFIAKNFNAETAITKLSSKYSKMTKDKLLKRGRILYDRANSLINKNNGRELAIKSFVECLNIIYLLYNNSLFLDEIEKSNIIGQHMNVVLNLGILYTSNNTQLGLALKMYNEASLLYELDTKGFSKSNMSIKSYILRGMSDVYIKQGEYLSALGLIEEALQLATNNNDKQAIYQILCTKGRALFDAKQLQNAALIFNKAILLLIKIQKCKAKPYDLYDRDLYRNTALCYKCIAQEFCSVVYINSTKTYAVKNTEKSMQFWDKSAKAYHETVKIVKYLFTTHSFQYIQALYEWSDVLCTKGNYNKSYHIYQNIQTIFQQLDTQSQTEYKTIIDKTKQMIQTLRPYINGNTL